MGREGKQGNKKEQEQERKETRELGGAKKTPFKVGWVTLLLAGNCWAGKTWQYPGDCTGGVSPE